MEGPALSPSYTILKYNALLQQYQRNGSDDYLGAIDWKPQRRTPRSRSRSQANHYKSDTFFTLDPNGFMVQEADGTPAYLGNYTSFVPYGNPVSGACNTTSMGSGYTSSTIYTILSPANTPGGLPIINPACAVVTSYLRTQPTRIWTPTETIRLQSSCAQEHFDERERSLHSRGLRHALVLRERAGPEYDTLDDRSECSKRHDQSLGNLDGRPRHGSAYGDWGRLRDRLAGYSDDQPRRPGDLLQHARAEDPRSFLHRTRWRLPRVRAIATINYSGTLVPGMASLPHGINGTLALQLLRPGVL